MGACTPACTSSDVAPPPIGSAAVLSSMLLSSWMSYVQPKQVWEYHWSSETTIWYDCPTITYRVECGEEIWFLHHIHATRHSLHTQNLTAHLWTHHHRTVHAQLNLQILLSFLLKPWSSSHIAEHDPLPVIKLPLPCCCWPLPCSPKSQSIGQWLGLPHAEQIRSTDG